MQAPCSSRLCRPVSWRTTAAGSRHLAAATERTENANASQPYVLQVRRLPQRDRCSGSSSTTTSITRPPEMARCCRRLRRRKSAGGRAPLISRACSCRLSRLRSGFSLHEGGGTQGSRSGGHCQPGEWRPARRRTRCRASETPGLACMLGRTFASSSSPAPPCFSINLALLQPRTVPARAPSRPALGRGPAPAPVCRAAGGR